MLYPYTLPPPNSQIYWTDMFFYWTDILCRYNLDMEVFYLKGLVTHFKKFLKYFHVLSLKHDVHVKHQLGTTRGTSH